MNTKRIHSIDGLKVFGMLFIFLHHNTFWTSKIHGWGKISQKIFAEGYFAVTLFFLLSGILSYISIESKNNNIVYGFKKFTLYTWNRIKKYYPLYFLSAIPFLIVFLKDNVGGGILQTIPHLMLIQSFIPIPEVYQSRNGFSWFLSSLTFCFFCTLPLYRLMKVMRRRYSAMYIVGIWSIEFTVVALLRNNDMTHWMFYINPVFRALDYFQGMICGRIIADRKVQEKSKELTIIEIILLLIFFLMYYNNSIIPQAFRWGSYYLPILTAIIIVFSREQGIISHFLGNKVFEKLASISFEFYLIHYVIIVNFYVFFDKWPLWNLGILFMTSICTSFIMQWMMRKFNYKRHMGRNV